MRLIIASPPSLGQQPTSQSTLADSVPGVVASLCLQYGIEPARVFLRPMPRTGSGLGNAIPLPFPRRRLSLIRFHPCMRQADPLALRGLFAHELIHAKHYFESRWTDLIRFMFRYGLFLLTSQGTRTIGEDWVRQIELLTDLLAVKLGEGASIAAWKRFKRASMKQGLIRDPWDYLYMGPREVSNVAGDPKELERRLEQCLMALRARGPFHPFCRNRS